MQHKHDRSQIKNGKEHVGTGAGRSQNRKTFEKNSEPLKLAENVLGQAQNAETA